MAVKGSAFSLWPNPSTNTFWFSALDQRETLVYYRIFDVQGSLTRVGQAFLPGPVQVDVSGLAGGLYFLEIAGEADHELLKFVILQ